MKIYNKLNLTLNISLREPDALGIMVVLKKLLENNFDARIVIPFIVHGQWKRLQRLHSTSYFVYLSSICSHIF